MEGCNSFERIDREISKEGVYPIDAGSVAWECEAYVLEEFEERLENVYILTVQNSQNVVCLPNNHGTFSHIRNVFDNSFPPGEVLRETALAFAGTLEYLSKDGLIFAHRGSSGFSLASQKYEFAVDLTSNIRRPADRISMWLELKTSHKPHSENLENLSDKIGNLTGVEKMALGIVVLDAIILAVIHERNFS